MSTPLVASTHGLPAILRRDVTPLRIDLVVRPLIASKHTLPVMLRGDVSPLRLSGVLHPSVGSKILHRERDVVVLSVNLSLRLVDDGSKSFWIPRRPSDRKRFDKERRDNSRSHVWTPSVWRGDSRPATADELRPMDSIVREVPADTLQFLRELGKPENRLAVTSSSETRRMSEFARLGGFQIEGDELNEDRETTIDQPIDRNRRHQYQLKYNPFKLDRAALEEQVRTHPDFMVDAARHEIQITNTPVVEIAKKMGVGYDWLRQSLSRGNKELDLYESDPQAALTRELVGSREEAIPAGFNISVVSNNRVEIIYLGELTESPQRHLDILHRLKKEKAKDAVKYERRKAREKGWSGKRLALAEKTAHARVRETYRPFFEMLQSQIDREGNVVTFSPLG
jgi:hypothetical protein